MVVPSKIATSVLLLSLFRLSGSYVVEPRIRHAKLAQTSTALFMIDNGVQNVVSRRCALTVAAALVPVLVAGFSPAVADVSDGSSLPQGARQFARVVKLKTDLKVGALGISMHRGIGLSVPAYTLSVLCS